MSISVSRSGARLGDGMTIVAKIQAHLLGWRLLELDADIVLSPADPPPAGVIEATSRQTTALARPLHGQAPLPARNGRGPIGSGLEDVRRSLEAGAKDLAAAKERMP